METECECPPPHMSANLPMPFRPANRSIRFQYVILGRQGCLIHFAEQVIFTLSASFILFVTAFLMLGVPSNIKKDPPSVRGTSVLEMLWVGAHFRALRKRLNAITYPSSRDLRFAGMLDVCFTKSELAQESGSAEALPLLNLRAGTGVGIEDTMHGIVRIPLVMACSSC